MGKTSHSRLESINGVICFVLIIIIKVTYCYSSMIFQHACHWRDARTLSGSTWSLPESCQAGQCRVGWAAGAGGRGWREWTPTRRSSSCRLPGQRVYRKRRRRQCFKKKFGQKNSRYVIHRRQMKTKKRMDDNVHVIDMDTVSFIIKCSFKRVIVKHETIDIRKRIVRSPTSNKF